MPQDWSLSLRELPSLIHQSLHDACYYVFGTVWLDRLKVRSALIDGDVLHDRVRVLQVLVGRFSAADLPDDDLSRIYGGDEWGKPIVNE